MIDVGGWHLAQVNVALPQALLDTPVMAGFVRALDDVNWLADRSTGFVWRLHPQNGLVTLGPLDGCQVIVTLSVWTSVESLQRYVYRSAHALFMQRRSRWFEPIGGFTTALWWVPEGCLPELDDAMDRLESLRADGPSPRAFSLGLQFGPDGLRAGRR
ncbi:MAG: DUF3291 domain-containing protein [Actinomycetota bacterium]|nr:DUF3291 domain-containing protein [Actinomycetota bacterium]